MRTNSLESLLTIGSSVDRPPTAEQSSQVLPEVRVVLGDDDPGDMGRAGTRLIRAERRSQRRGSVGICIGQPAHRLLDEDRRDRGDVDRSRVRARVVSGGGHQWNPHDERRPLSFPGGHRDRAAVKLDQRFDESEADPAAFDRSASRAFDAIEPVEKMRKLVLRHTHAGVGDGELRLASQAVFSQADLDRPVEGELERVREQIEDDLLPHRRVHGRQAPQRTAVDDELDARRIKGAPEHARRRDRVLGEIDAPGRSGHVSSLDPGKVEQPVDEPQQTLGVPLCDRQQGPVGRIQVVAESLLQVSQRAKQQCQRRPELMADVAEERRLCPVEFSESFEPAVLFFVRAGHRDGGGDLGTDKREKSPVCAFERESGADTQDKDRPAIVRLAAER